MKRRLLGLTVMMALASGSAMAQKAALKTNLVTDAMATVNLGAEFALAPRWTLDLSGNYNGWTLKDNKKWKHWLAQPEARYWFCDKFMGHFVGMHALGGQFNAGGLKYLDFKYMGADFAQLKDHRYEGWMMGVGFAYGYAWALGRHWNMEAELGVGYMHTNADKYSCEKCGDKVASDVKNDFFTVTKAAVNLVYVF